MIETDGERERERERESYCDKIIMMNNHRIMYFSYFVFY